MIFQSLSFSSWSYSYHHYSNTNSKNGSLISALALFHEKLPCHLFYFIILTPFQTCFIFFSKYNIKYYKMKLLSDNQNKSANIVFKFTCSGKIGLYVNPIKSILEDTRAGAEKLAIARARRDAATAIDYDVMQNKNNKYLISSNHIYI